MKDISEKDLFIYFMKESIFFISTSISNQKRLNRGKELYYFRKTEFYLLFILEQLKFSPKAII